MPAEDDLDAGAKPVRTLSRATAVSTIVDIANRAGVSRTQVSDVLNNKRVDHVSLKKRERILQVVKDLGYQPHQSAQALRKGYANEFALFFPAPYTHRINAMLGTIHADGLADGCLPVQYSFNVFHDQERKQRAFQALLSRRPRGLFLSLFDVSIEDVVLARARGVENILLYDVEPHPDFPTLVLPIEEIGYLAAQHLLQVGHRRLGIIKPPPPAPARVYALRVAGMRRALSAFPDASLVELPWPADDLRPTLEGGTRFLDEFGLGDGTITGLYAYSDEYAVPLIANLTDRSIQIPRDLALVGTDDIPFAAMVQPTLTTIQFDQDSLGKRAVAMINALIDGQDLEQPKVGSLVPRLFRRQTT
jgi:DNA-binding LacI/PurR family transcriptional regulator